jgi:hypothetical protein
MPLALTAGAVDDIEFARRRVAIDAAGRSCDAEGLPPPSAFAQRLYDDYAAGARSTQDVIDMLVRHHRQD